MTQAAVATAVSVSARSARANALAERLDNHSYSGQAGVARCMPERH